MGLLRKNLLVQFSVVSFVVIGMIAAILAHLLAGKLQTEALEDLVAEAVGSAAPRVLGQLKPEDFAAPMAGETYADFHRFVQNSIVSERTAGVKLWSPQGQVIYSQDPDSVGHRFPENQNLQRALEGENAVQLKQSLDHENASDSFKGPIMEVYTPLHYPGSAEPDGVLEIYQYYGPTATRITSLRRWTFGAIGLGFFFLFGSLVSIVGHGWSQINRSERERERLLAQERRQRFFSDAVSRVSLAINATLDPAGLLDLICRESLALFEADAAYVWLVQGDELVGYAGHGLWLDKFLNRRLSLTDTATLGIRVVHERRPIYVNDASTSSQVNQELVQIFQIKAILGVPLVKGDHTLGALMILHNRPSARFNDQDIETAVVLGSHAAIAIENARLYEEAQRRVQRLTALHKVDQAITSSLDLRSALSTLLDQLTTTLGIHAADVLMHKPQTGTLEYAAQIGFHTGALRHTRLRIGDGNAGLAALKQQIISIPNLDSAEDEMALTLKQAQEGFASYYAVPLIANEQIKGVLEIFHRQPIAPDDEWLTFLETLASQAAIVIDNAELFENLQRSHTDLTRAYDTTLEGWARFLELRDKETEGHTQRVTEMTLRLAKELNLPPEEITQLRRGALLHDIGKMGIPDRILHKPGPLTEEEWQIMRRHPVYAYQLLSPIDYLRPALDIPYCHHEKWDGSGYPRGLSGEQIPLAARLFALADVWDALLSDRPYRKAWEKGRVFAYFQANAGEHFDPDLVGTFLGLVYPQTVNAPDRVSAQVDGSAPIPPVVRDGE